jgi:hypothetical protein
MNGRPGRHLQWWHSGWCGPGLCRVGDPSRPVSVAARAVRPAGEAANAVGGTGELQVAPRPAILAGRMPLPSTRWAAVSA